MNKLITPIRLILLLGVSFNVGHNMVLSYNYSAAAHFDGYVEALKRYMQHLPIWTPPSGDYSLRIASAATRATANKTTM
jgi:hypothetical protein